MNIPNKFLSIIEKSQTHHSIVLDVITSFQPILEDNKLYFFEEYTDHGIKHIEKVLASAEFMISDESFENLSPTEVTIFILSVILHDIGMHIEYSTFKAMLDGKYDKYLIETLDDKTWSVLWNDYLSEVKKFSSVQKNNIFGDENIHFGLPNLSNKDLLSGYDKKLIGEFIRRYHSRIAHEIALGGFIGSGDLIIEFGNDNLELIHKQLSGILARSHGMNIRNTFDYLKNIAHKSWRNPSNVNIVFLMIVIRLSDYIQIDKDRVNKYLLKLKTFNSPISLNEHKAHLAITSINFGDIDNEGIYVLCNPDNSQMFVKLKKLIFDIQNEFDISWAILGEIYGFTPSKKPSIKFRRINSNLTDKAYLLKLNFIPEKVSFKVDNSLSKLLVEPLYGNNPTFGVRELLQNSIDACVERDILEKNRKNNDYMSKIRISLNRISDDFSEFEILDNGKGMSETEIVNYFLNIGSSFRKSFFWKKKFIDDSGKTTINRNGKFGIGILASFLLGDEIKVETRNYDEEFGYSFTAKIDSEFIEIIKNHDDLKIGTRILIKVNNDKRDELLKNPNSRNYNDKSIEWTKWFVNNDFDLTFFLDGSIYEFEKVKYPKLYSFKTNLFEKIEWNYIFDDAEYLNRYDFSTKKIVACNDIIITNKLDYSKSEFKYPVEVVEYEGLKHYAKGNYVINKKPSIFVNDKEGIFPLRLDRNDIDCIELPFESELFEEVSKKFIADLLNFKIDAKSLTKFKIFHNTKILYGKNGFTLDFDYFINGLKNQYNFIKIITDKSEFSNSILENENYFFKIVFNEKINLSYQDRNVLPYNVTRILLRKDNYVSLFEGVKKRFPKYRTDEIEIEYSDNEFIIYKFKYYKDNPTLLKEFNKIDKSILNDALSIQELKPSYFEIRSGEVLEKLLKKYIKNNYVIPYDIIEREKIFNKAFKDLKAYMI